MIYTGVYKDLLFVLVRKYILPGKNILCNRIDKTSQINIAGHPRL